MGTIAENGGPGAEGTTVNIPLPPGSGTGAYYYTFDRVVIPALHKFKPDLILVSSGFDASYADPLGSMMMSSEGFGVISQKMISAAETLCEGRIVFAHEGGYSKDYVPFCGLAVLEALAGVKSGVVDPYLEEVKLWGYQECQPHQAAVVDAVAAMLGLGAEADASSSSSSTFATLSTQEKVVVNAIRGVLSGISDPSRRAAVLEEVLKQSS
jgi:acetoin utilization deacetylase AcuC-like enzyme